MTCPHCNKESGNEPWHCKNCKKNAGTDYDVMGPCNLSYGECLKTKKGCQCMLKDNILRFGIL